MAGQKGRSGGRNRKPTWLKVINGSAQQHPERLNRDEPQVEVQVPEPPEWLNERAKEIFRELGEDAATLRVIAETDVHALALAAQAADEYLAADQLVSDSGLVLTKTDQAGNVIAYANPAVRIRESAWRRFSLALRGFGLDPQSRATVKTLGGKPRNRFASLKDGGSSV